MLAELRGAPTCRRLIQGGAGTLLQSTVGTDANQKAAQSSGGRRRPLTSWAGGRRVKVGRPCRGRLLRAWWREATAIALAMKPAFPAPWRSSEGMFGDVRVFDRLYTPPTRVVYVTCMSRVRTNIEIEDTYLQAVMDRYGLHTKTEAVDLALRHLAGQPMSREEALAMRGVHAIGKLPADTGPARAR